MKYLFVATALAAALVLAETASAQMYAPTQPPPLPTATPSWTEDTGGTTDHPVHMPGDHSADALNAQYRNGITAPYGSGFPAPYYVPAR